MKTFVIYITILLTAITIFSGEALAQQDNKDYNGIPDFNAEYAPSGMQFSVVSA